MSRAASLCLAEITYLLGLAAPTPVAHRLWALTIRLNRHHDLAALNRALVLRSDHTRGWQAFEELVRQVGNPRSTSASDLELCRLPLLLLQRAIGRLVLGPAGRLTQTGTVQLALIRGARHLADTHSSGERASDDERARRCRQIRRSLTGAPESSPAAAAGASRGSTDAYSSHQPDGLPSPFVALVDTRSALADGDLEAASDHLASAIRYLPEEAEAWSLKGMLELRLGREAEARASFERALALHPQELEAFLELLRLDGHACQRRLPDESLEVVCPAVIALGQSVGVECRIDADQTPCDLHVLPPAGLGLTSRPSTTKIGHGARAHLAIQAQRPHRVNGSPWPLLFVAISSQGYAVRQASVSVPADGSGRILVTVTEDHEIHEERGQLTPQLLRRLLIDKSARAARSAPAWTHMIETGSTLALLDEAASRYPSEWEALRDRAREHLVDEVAAGHDIQPHLHAFNDPAYEHFPYDLTADEIRPSLEFLLTPARSRGDWASACPPPGYPPHDRPDRLESVERSVAQTESIGRLGDPSHRALLWPRGLLEYGSSPADCAWSAVALRRAGLVAVSDLAKPSSPFAHATPAFFCDWEDPGRPDSRGPLLQLPIAANLEGDFLMGPWLLRRRARRSIEALRDESGRTRPGVHLFTLLTHDKFINARGERHEFRFDEHYGDWPTIRRHVAAWQQAGATFVTARQGIREVLDDLSLRPTALLENETFLSGPGRDAEVRFALTLLGAGISCSREHPQHLLVTVPPAIRPFLQSIEVRQGDRRVTCEEDRSAHRFWIVIDRSDLPLCCHFRVASVPGPRLASLEPDGVDSWVARLVAPEPHRRARVLLPWELISPSPSELEWRVTSGAADSPGCQPHRDGLLVYNLSSTRPEALEYAVDLKIKASRLRDS